MLWKWYVLIQYSYHVNDPESLSQRPQSDILVDEDEDNAHSDSEHQLSKRQKATLPVFVSPERAQVEESLRQQHRSPRPADMANLCAF
jgi:hypothetical protein